MPGHLLLLLSLIVILIKQVVFYHQMRSFKWFSLIEKMNWDLKLIFFLLCYANVPHSSLKSKCLALWSQKCHSVLILWLQYCWYVPSRWKRTSLVYTFIPSQTQQIAVRKYSSTGPSLESVVISLNNQRRCIQLGKALLVMQLTNRKLLKWTFLELLVQ